MPGKILVGFDGSTYSVNALRFASRLAESLSATLHVIIILPPDAPADLLVEKARNIAPNAKIEVVRAPPLADSPASIIASYAERKGFNMIVVGAKGVTSREDTSIGSTALWLAANASTTVVIVR